MSLLLQLLALRMVIAIMSVRGQPTNMKTSLESTGQLASTNAVSKSQGQTTSTKQPISMPSLEEEWENQTDEAEKNTCVPRLQYIYVYKENHHEPFFVPVMRCVSSCGLCAHHNDRCEVKSRKNVTKVIRISNPLTDHVIYERIWVDEDKECECLPSEGNKECEYRDLCEEYDKKMKPEKDDKCISVERNVQQQLWKEEKEED